MLLSKTAIYSLLLAFEGAYQMVGLIYQEVILIYVKEDSFIVILSDSTCIDSSMLLIGLATHYKEHEAATISKVIIQYNNEKVGFITIFHECSTLTWLNYSCMSYNLFHATYYYFSPLLGRLVCQFGNQFFFSVAFP